MPSDGITDLIRHTKLSLCNCSPRNCMEKLGRSKERIVANYGILLYK